MNLLELDGVDRPARVSLSDDVSFGVTLLVGLRFSDYVGLLELVEGSLQSLNRLLGGTKVALPRRRAATSVETPKTSRIWL